MIIKSFDSERLSTSIDLLYFQLIAGRYQTEDLYAHFINEEPSGLGWETVCLNAQSRARFGRKNMEYVPGITHTIVRKATGVLA